MGADRRKNRGSLNASLIPTVVSPSDIPNSRAPKRGPRHLVRFNFDAFTDERPLILWFFGGYLHGIA